MNNNKGFTLTEILLAAMIVGIIGVALAALTTAAMRESGIGRTKTMLRNQLSLALRQLRQDIHEATRVEPSGGNLTIEKGVQLGPDHDTSTVQYTYSDGEISRNGEVWLTHVKSLTAGDPAFTSPEFEWVDLPAEGETGGRFHSLLRVRIIVEVNSNPKVNDVIEEVFMLPHGVGVRHE